MKSKLTIYMSKELHKSLKHAAIDEGRTITSIIEELVFTWLEGRLSSEVRSSSDDSEVRLSDDGLMSDL